MSDKPNVCLAFALIAEYAEWQGWIPIGFRSFPIGSWTVTVNGTRDERDHVPPYHARVEHHEYLAVMVLHPYGGAAAGGEGIEDAFIAAMQAALAARGRA